MKVEFVNELLPVREAEYETLPRSLRTPFVDEWTRRRDELPASVERVRAELNEAMAAGRGEELLPFTGQSAGLVHDVLPAAEIVTQLAREAERALAAAGALVETG